MLWKIIKFLHNCKTVSKDKLQKEDIQQMAENYQKLDLWSKTVFFTFNFLAMFLF